MSVYPLYTVLADTLTCDRHVLTILIIIVRYYCCCRYHYYYYCCKLVVCLERLDERCMSFRRRGETKRKTHTHQLREQFINLHFTPPTTTTISNPPYRSPPYKICTSPYTHDLFPTTHPFGHSSLTVNDEIRMVPARLVAVARAIINDLKMSLCVCV